MTDQTKATRMLPSILVVEDDPVSAEVLCHTLVNAGFAVTHAENGEQGLKLLREHPCKLVISDIVMPQMDGLALCRAIKFDDTLWPTPVILITMLSEPADIIKALDAGADGFITKPFVPSHLLSRIHTLLAHPIRRKLAEERRKVIVQCDGNEYTVSAGNQQMANLLFSVYEHSQFLNQAMAQAQTRLHNLNRSLEQQVRERTEAESAARDQALRACEQVRQLIECNADGIVVVNQNGQTLFDNQAAAKIFGWRADDLLGKDFGIPIIAGETAELAIPSTAGAVKHIELRSAEILWDNQPAQLVTLRDITAHKLINEQLVEQINELNRWRDVTVEREMRNLTLKREVNALLRQAGQPPRYPSAGEIAP